MLKHVGRMVRNQRRVIVAYKVVPGEPDNCVVVTTENLEAGDHDALIKLVESPAGQEADDLATVMMRTQLSDGANMLARFHTTGKMIKAKTSEIEMIPNQNTSIKLSELNEAIASQKGVTVADLAVKGPDGATIQPAKDASGPAMTASEMAAAAPSVAPIADDGVISDEALAKKFRSDADRLSKEAAELRRQAEELVPTKRKQHRRRLLLVSKNNLPPEVISHWPEIFKDVEIKAVPIEYIHTIHVYFHDGKIWQIDMDEQKAKDANDLNGIENSLETFLEQYNDEISHVDFRLNTTKVVQDVKSRTKSFMKKRK